MSILCDPLRIQQDAQAIVERSSGLEIEPFRPKGKFHLEHVRDGKLIGKYELPNGIVDVGLNAILNIMFGGATQITTWYIGLIDNASFTALANGDTMSSHSGWVESDHYSSPSTRGEWTEGTASGRSMTNATSVDFVMNATRTIKGVFITSGSAKNGTTGTLWSTAAFGSTVSVNSGDTLKITYTLSG